MSAAAPTANGVSNNNAINAIFGPQLIPAQALIVRKTSEICSKNLFGVCNDVNCPYPHKKSQSANKFMHSKNFKPVAATGFKPRVCKFFEQGKCIYGYNCRFVHIK